MIPTFKRWPAACASTACYSRWHSSLGDYYTVSTVVGAVFDTHQDLADLALEYGVIDERQQIEGE
jgi:hypothetical protein